MSLASLLDDRIMPAFVMLAEWSIRWGTLILCVWIGLTIRPPRRTAARYALLSATLVAGLLMPLMPPLTVTRTVSSGPAPALPIATAGMELAPPTEPPALAPSAPVPPSRTEAFRPLPAGELFTIGIAVAWGLGATWSAIRLAAGLVRLRRMRADATPPDDESRRLFETCSRELNLNRPVDFASHPEISSPAVLGGVRPIVLVPIEWRDLPEPSRRASLLHELSHVARRDDLIRFIHELIRVPFFFHPLVGRLLARLHRETERMCDEAALALGVDPLDFARLLLDHARNGGRLRRSPLALSFFERGTVLYRINRLLEENAVTVESRRLARRDLFILALIVGMLALPIGGFRVVATADEPKPAEQPGGIALSGIVTDVDRQPIAGADVAILVEASRFPSLPTRALKSGPDGRFSFEVPRVPARYRVLAAKSGLSIGSTQGFHDPSAKTAPPPLTVVLQPSRPFEVSLVDEADRPVVGARAVIEIAASVYETNGLPHGLSQGLPKQADGGMSSRSRTFGMTFRYFGAWAASVPSFASLVTAVSDEEGRLRFASVFPNAWLKPIVTTRDGRSMRLEPIGPARSAELPPSPGLGFITGDPSEKIRVRLVESARIVGRLESRVPGVSVANRVVRYQSRHSRTDPVSPANLGAETRTDAQGRFAFESLGRGAVVVSPVILDDEPATCRAAELELVPGQSAEARLELIEGVLVEGRVESSDGKPIAAAMVGCHGPHLPQNAAAVRSTETDADGVYRFRVPSGENYFYLMRQIPGHIHQPGRDGKTVAIPDAAGRFTLPTFKVEKAP